MLLADLSLRLRLVSAKVPAIFECPYGSALRRSFVRFAPRLSCRLPRCDLLLGSAFGTPAPHLLQRRVEPASSRSIQVAGDLQSEPPAQLPPPPHLGLSPKSRSGSARRPR